MTTDASAHHLPVPGSAYQCARRPDGSCSPRSPGWPGEKSGSCAWALSARFAAGRGGDAGGGVQVAEGCPQAALTPGGQCLLQDLDGQAGVGHGPVPVGRDRDAEEAQHGVEAVAGKLGERGAGELHCAQQAGGGQDGAVLPLPGDHGGLGVGGVGHQPVRGAGSGGRQGRPSPRRRGDGWPVPGR